MATGYWTPEDAQRPGGYVRLFSRLRPREGWFVLILTWVAVTALPFASLEGGLITGIAPAVWLASLGLFAAWWLAHSRLKGVPATPVLALVGALADLLWGVYVLSIWSLVPQAIRWLSWGLSCGTLRVVGRHCTVPAPAVTYFAEQAAALSAFGRRIGWWLNGVITGQGIPDNLVLIAAACLIAWAAGAWAGWWVVRRGRPFAAILPAGVLLTEVVFVTDSGTIWLLTFLGAATLLLALARFDWLAAGWDRSGTDYSDELRLSTGAVALLVTGIVITLAPTLPFITSQDLSRAFWHRFEEPWRSVEESINRSVPGLEGKRSLVPPGGYAAGGLPRAHLLGGRPELGREVALRVGVRGALPDDLLRWRGQTFAYYNGQGWQIDSGSTRQGTQDVTTTELPAGQPWTDTPLASRHPVLTSVQVVEASRAALYSPGEPLSVDQPYMATLRAPGELIALYAAGSPQNYTVLATVSDLDVAVLRDAGTAYPAEISQIYLQLPDTLPAEVRAKAREITAGAATPYDAALKIESALRQLPYSLDVPVPPAGRELVSWFLFDLRRGYCDYFATAMTVLARASGIPARLAVGYATGTYDPQTQQYVVTEAQAHSWPELYFPGAGWVPFEPTPAETVPVRANAGYVPGPGLYPPSMSGPVNVEGGLSELRQLAEERSGQVSRESWRRRVLALLNGVLAVVVAWRWLRPYRRPAEDAPAAWYERMARLGARLGRPLKPAETPREYAGALVDLAETAADHTWPGRRQGAERAAAVVRADGLALVEAFERARFAPHTAPAVPGHRRENEDRRWSALWAALRRLWLAVFWRI